MSKLEAEIVEILLVEDNPGDIKLTYKTIEQSKMINKISVVKDGEIALDYLNKRNGYEDVNTPDLVILDLNLPKVDGYEVLREMKKDNNLSTIPVVILTASSAEEDILKTYKLDANCFVTKPLDIDQFKKVVTSIQDFWFTIVKNTKNGV